jgi:Tol biopolymer transport system component
MPWREKRAALYISFCFLLVISCTPANPPALQTTLYLYRFDPPAFVEFSSDFQPVDEIPFSIPLQCSLYNIFPAPVGSFLLVELSCPNGQTILFLDTDTGSVSQPVTGTDSHYLAWASDGTSVYLKVDSLGDTGVVRVYTRGNQQQTSLIGWTYDLSARPNSDDIIFTFSRGLGYGSELHASQGNGRSSSRLLEDPLHYISFARFAPDGRKISFIKIPDTQTPYTIGELWIMNTDGSDPRKLADVDAGHGFAANWSPDGKWIAFVGRENPDDEGADQSPDLLISNIYLIHTQSGELSQITTLTRGHVETPHWSPAGNSLAFNIVLNGRMDVQIADIISGEIRPLTTDSTCCPAWLRK